MGIRLPDLQYLKYEVKEWWERLGVRAWLNRHPKLIIGASVGSVVLLLAIVIVLSLPKKVVPVEDYEKEWFYDLNTGELYAVRLGQTPPIEAPSGALADGGPAGVRAYVFSYESEPNEAERFIGFLETTDPNFDSSELSPVDLRVSGAETWGQGRLIRLMEDMEWVSATSAKGQFILRGVFRPDAKGRRPRYVRPE
jgi:hypothetical protein